MGIYKGGVSALDFTDKIYGVDLKIVDGDLESGVLGSFSNQIGSENVLSALKKRLATELGFHPFDPTYGMDFSVFIGGKKGSKSKQAISSAITSCVYQDSRVSSLNSILITDHETRPDTYYVDISVTLINQQVPTSINLIYPWTVSSVTTRLVTSEVAKIASSTTVYTNFYVYDVVGVWLSTDPNKTGTNYFTGGSSEGNLITLGSNVEIEEARVLIDYYTIEATRDLGTYGFKSESLVATTDLLVTTINDIFDIEGVWLIEDTNLTGTNYYTGGSFSGKEVTLGTALPTSHSIVRVNYYATTS